VGGVIDVHVVDQHDGVLVLAGSLYRYMGMGLWAELHIQGEVDAEVVDAAGQLPWDMLWCRSCTTRRMGKSIADHRKLVLGAGFSEATFLLVSPLA
jgi:hypothetical protein